MKKICSRCLKTDPDLSEGCERPMVYSPAVGDWLCLLECSDCSGTGWITDFDLDSVYACPGCGGSGGGGFSRSDNFEQR